MNETNFVYWLQGFFELTNEKTLNERQVQIIKDHLVLCFDKVTPSRIGDANFCAGGPSVVYKSNISCSINPNNDNPGIGFGQIY